MIPTLIILGVMAGMVPRGWVAIPILVIGWPLLVMLIGADDSGAGLVMAAAVTAVNVTAGFTAGLLLLRPVATRLVDRLAP